MKSRRHPASPLRRHPALRPFRRILPAIAPALAVLATGCGLTEGRPAPPCPPVLVVREASEFTVYRDGPGRDITDVVFDAKIADFTGGCEWNRARNEVDVEMRLAFDIERGPANRDRKARYSYFVAIPAFHPAPQGKQIFAGELTFPENITRMRTGDTLRLKIPIPPNKGWDDFPIYVGFQLTPQQIEDSRRRRAR